MLICWQIIFARVFMHLKELWSKIKKLYLDNTSFLVIVETFKILLTSILHIQLLVDSELFS